MLKEKDHIKFGGIEWDVINTEGDNALLLASECVKEMRFGETADYAKSDVRDYLENDLFDQVKEEFEKEYDADIFDLVVEAEILLRADDGTYLGEESIKSRLFLLPDVAYRGYRENIKQINDWWWTATAYSSAYSNLVRYVYTDGSLTSNNAYNGYLGVRPACVIKSSIFEKLKKREKKEEELEQEKQIEYIKSKLDTRSLLEQAAEECAELSQALLKNVRAMGYSKSPTPATEEETRNAIEEEYTDVIFCMELLGLKGANKNIRKMKTERYYSRIKESAKNE